jgi:hypothetical protein
MDQLLGDVTEAAIPRWRSLDTVTGFGDIASRTESELSRSPDGQNSDELSAVDPGQIVDPTSRQ